LAELGFAFRRGPGEEFEPMARRLRIPALLFQAGSLGRALAGRRFLKLEPQHPHARRRAEIPRREFVVLIEIHVETLGSVSRICSDKTGTLTRNEMVVVTVATAGASYEVTGEGYSPRGEVLKSGKPAAKDPVLEAMARASVLCNESSIHEDQGVWKLTGDPTEGALLPFAAKAGLSAQAVTAVLPRTNMIPFESEHKFMATLHESLLFVKGAPDVIINYCDRQELSDGTQAPLDRAFWEKKNEEIAIKGQRVLALAWLKDAKIDEATFNAQGLTKELVLLGLVGIIDPPRDEAIAAVKECHLGSIRVTMITGDHAVTAASIAKMLGIGDGKSYVTGSQIEEIDDDALEAKCRRIDVFARTSPEHKLRLVRAMQASGQVVSMTGDGVNDAPALKQADVGVAMGIKGTEVSKEAAEMVLTDDNFASITAAVREGRTVYNNIEKAILFMLPTNGGQALTILAAIFLGLVLPVTPPQALFTYASFMHYIFGSESVPLWIWKWLLLGGVVFFIVVELEKALVRLVYPQVKKTA
jgi:magnesium-transporting ATPase (P-type)